MKRLFFVAAVMLLAGLIVAWVFRVSIRDTWEAWNGPSLPAAQTYHPTTATSTPTVVTTTNQLPATKPRPVTATSDDPLAWKGALPEQVNLAVPFLSQAPKQNWDMPYQEACEEAATIMVDAFYRGVTKPFTPEQGDEAILSAVAFEEQYYGDRPDMTAKQTAQFVADYFQRSGTLIRPVSGANQIKSALANGYPVIVPASGKELGNPNFRNGGPLYHMLVIKGYLPDGRWITNDPGTRKGADYLYDAQPLLDAMHDWNGGNVTSGTRLMLVILPEM